MKPVQPTNPQTEYYDSNITIPTDIKSFDVSSLPDGFFAAVVAPRRSGKSEQIQSLLEDIKQTDKKFDTVFLFSRTNAGFENQIPPNYRFRDLKHLSYICNKQLEIKNYNKKTRDKKNRIKSRVLLVLDDMIAEEKGENSLKHNQVIRTLAVNGRHLGDNVPGNGISVIIITQSIKAIPKTVRQQFDVVFTGRITSRIERQTIVEEFSTLKSDREGIKTAYNLFDAITLSEPFRFMVCSNHIPNKRCCGDYISFIDASYPVSQTHMCGEKIDWEITIEEHNIF
jgi:hypothetical protein